MNQTSDAPNLWHGIILMAVLQTTTPLTLIAQESRRGQEPIDPQQVSSPTDADDPTDTPPPAQEGALNRPATQPAKPESTPPPRGEVGADARDPFTVLSDTEDRSQMGPQFVPSEGPTPVPPIRLRGYIEVLGRQPVALIDIERHGSFVVREGDTISLQARRSDPVLKIRDLSGLSVTVEVGTIGQVIVVR